MTAAGPVAESVGTLKPAGSELLDVVAATTLRSVDVAEGLIAVWSGPLVDLARAPVTVARAAYETGRTGARRTLAVV